MIIDYVNEKGGVARQVQDRAGRRRQPVKTESAINEAEEACSTSTRSNPRRRVLERARVPLAEKVDKQRSPWITTAIRRRPCSRPQPPVHVPAAAERQPLRREHRAVRGALLGRTKLKKAPKDVRAAIIYEDGPYGTGVRRRQRVRGEEARDAGRAEGSFSVQAPDLSSLVTKLRASRPDVIFHTGYKPGHRALPAPGQEQGLRR